MRQGHTAETLLALLLGSTCVVTGSAWPVEIHKAQISGLRTEDGEPQWTKKYGEVTEKEELGKVTS
jgi:hypothetical protein